MGNCCRTHKSIDEEPKPLLEPINEEPKPLLERINEEPKPLLEPINEEPKPLFDKEHLVRLMQDAANHRVQTALEAAARDISCTASLYAPDETERTLLQQAVRKLTNDPDLISCNIDGKYVRLSWDIGYLGSSWDICYTPPPVYKQ